MLIQELDPMTNNGDKLLYNILLDFYPTYLWLIKYKPDNIFVNPINESLPPQNVSLANDVFGGLLSQTN